ncbi:MAG: ROK family protein [Thermoanaerobacteraceae bacterium]|nr:ROK family protein [Thermoanaerobacteraceae bacterium]
MIDIACGVDLGGTKINTGIVNSKGEILYNIKIPTEAQKGPYEVIERIIKSIYEVVDKTGVKLKDLSGIGVGSPGPLDAEAGIVLCPPNLTGWVNIPLTEILKKEFGIKIRINNDANAAALAEHLFGKGRGINNFVYITVSTGIGGGVIINGKLYNGANSNAAEIGHHTINFDGPRCGCGNYGCFEAFASGTALAGFAKDMVDSGKDTIIKDIAGNRAIKAEYVFEAAEKGDKIAIELIEKEAFYLGIGIANIMSFYNPERIAVGGGISCHWKVLYDKIMATVNKRALKPNKEICDVVKAQLGENVGLLGAALLVLRESKGIL